MNKLFGALLAAAMLCGCVQSDSSGKQYLADLGNLIGKADRIVLVEHSSSYDLFQIQKGEQIPLEEIAYRRIQLTAQQKDRFQSMIMALPPETQNAFPACIIEAHHRIEFYQAGKKIDSMEVCFVCGQVEWGGTKATPPWALYGGLEGFVASVGLQPKREWASLAAKTKGLQ
ncbi:hypothetical protein [Chitinimonas sp.]|uniref:hypothetical protein n=1 Tax=Chitinimonas sp. TaxID=1934313 RepID=UPI0035AFDA66